MSQVQVSLLSQDVMQVCRQCPISTFQNAYIRAARKLCADSRWLRSTLLGSTTAPVSGVGTALYNLGSDAYHEVVGIAAVSIQESANDKHGLTNQDSSEWDADDEFGVPSKYAYLPGGQIALHKTPDAVYALTITLVLQPKMGATSIDDSLLVKWREALNDGTLGFLLSLKGGSITWSDPVEGGRRMAMFEAAINEARSDALAGYNAGALSTGGIGPRSASVRTRMQPI